MSDDLKDFAKDKALDVAKSAWEKISKFVKTRTSNQKLNYEFGGENLTEIKENLKLKIAQELTAKYPSVFPTATETTNAWDILQTLSHAQLLEYRKHEPFSNISAYDNFVEVRKTEIEEKDKVSELYHYDPERLQNFLNRLRTGDDNEKEIYRLITEDILKTNTLFALEEVKNQIFVADIADRLLTNSPADVKNTLTALKISLPTLDESNPANKEAAQGVQEKRIGVNENVKGFEDAWKKLRVHYTQAAELASTIEKNEILIHQQEHAKEDEDIGDKEAKEAAKSRNDKRQSRVTELRRELNRMSEKKADFLGKIQEMEEKILDSASKVVKILDTALEIKPTADAKLNANISTLLILKEKFYTESTKLSKSSPDQLFNSASGSDLRKYIESLNQASIDTLKEQTTNYINYLKPKAKISSIQALVLLKKQDNLANASGHGKIADEHM